MPRSVLAYLSDIVVCCDALAVTLDGVDLPEYEANRTLRSAVERELTIIGEAVNSLSKVEPEVASRISHARMIVGFRNLLVHDYPAVLNAVVWAVARNDAPVLRSECADLIEVLRPSE